MKVVLRANHKGSSIHLEKTGGSILIGRKADGATVDFDLGADALVSRKHARLWSEGHCGWLEDTDSKRGTRLNNREIRGQGPQRIAVNDEIRLGETILIVEDLGLGREKADTSVPTVTTTNTSSSPLQPPATLLAPELQPTDLERRLAMLCELPRRLVAEKSLAGQFQVVIEHAIALIPGATRGALLLCENSQPEKLTLAACVPHDQPAVSLNIVRRVLQEQDAVLWPDPATAAEWPSITQHAIAAAIYAPLIWDGDALGVLCVDCTDTSKRFTESDRRIVRAVACYAAIVLGQHCAEESRCRQSEFTMRLIAGRFPNELCERMLRSVADGSLRVGAHQSPVTVLISDIRGFTKLNEKLGAQRMSELLDEYFPRLIEVIFQHKGIVATIAGDSILAVFGSLEPDRDQQIHAVRAALGMQEAVADLNATRANRGAPECQIGIGIDHGPALHGFVGNAERLEYTIIGNAANYASRYCAAAEGGQILISSAVHAHVWNLVTTEKALIPTKHEGDLPAFNIKKLVAFGKAAS